MRARRRMATAVGAVALALMLALALPIGAPSAQAGSPPIPPTLVSFGAAASNTAPVPIALHVVARSSLVAFGFGCGGDTSTVADSQGNVFHVLAAETTAGLVANVFNATPSMTGIDTLTWTFAGLCNSGASAFDAVGGGVETGTNVSTFANCAPCARMYDVAGAALAPDSLVGFSGFTYSGGTMGTVNGSVLTTNKANPRVTLFVDNNSAGGKIAEIVTIAGGDQSLMALVAITPTFAPPPVGYALPVLTTDPTATAYAVIGVAILAVVGGMVALYFVTSGKRRSGGSSESF